MRVLELGQGVSAAFCAMLLSDYGADVIKVEPPEGDETRRWGPFPQDQPDPEKSGLFFQLNTNKRGITLDLASERGREVLLGLVAGADVLVENLEPGSLRARGLDYDALARVNPQLVMISITPFGQTGPYAAWKGCDLNAFHLSAAGSRYCGRPGQPPLEQGTFSADYFGAYAGAAWGLAAVLGRDRVGSGQHIDVSCAEVIAAVFVGGQNIGCYAQEGTFESRTGVGMPLGAPATILPCKDGYVWMLALEKAQWRGLVHAMGDPEWANTELFDDMFARAQNSDVIYPLVEEWTRAHTKQEIMDLCQQNNCPSTAVFTVAEVAEHPHLRERGSVVELAHPVLGKLRSLGAPVHLTRSPGGPVRPAPLLGEHNSEVFLELGIARMRHHAAEELEARVRATAQADASPPAPGKLPLAGVRVANFGWGWLGPVAGQTLAFLGAEVYKIESRARIDINRNFPPFGGGIANPDRSLQNHAGWAGNGSITLNLKKPEAQAIARDVVAQCDVVLENFGPGVMDKLNLGYDALRAVKPDLVMASMPAAGLTGPLRGLRTYGMSLSSITGLDSLTGYASGPPVPMENAFADPLGGVIGAYAVLLGLHHRARTGEGQLIDFSQQEGVMQLIGPAFMDYVMNGRVAGPIGNRHPLSAAAPHGVFPCKGDDRWLSLAVFSQAQWEKLCTAMGQPDWTREPRFADLASRIAHIDALHEQVGRWTREFPDGELAQRLQALGIAAAPVLNVGDLLSNEHFKARGTFIEVTHPLGFRETIYDAYVKMSHVRPRVHSGPMIGQDNEAVFKGLMGMSAERYAELVEREVIF